MVFEVSLALLPHHQPGALTLSRCVHTKGNMDRHWEPRWTVEKRDAAACPTLDQEEGGLSHYMLWLSNDEKKDPGSPMQILPEIK